MANNLTGDYEAVVQVSVRKINGILATMHQNKVNPDASPTFEHSTPVQVGDLKIPKHDTAHFAKWYAGAVQDLRETGVLPSDARSVLSEKAPPGVSSVLKKGWRDLDIIRLEPAADGAVRGTAAVQLSNPTISLAERSIGEVTVHVDVRVHYDPDRGSALMPEPIHGEVRATYIVKPKTLGISVGARKALSVQVSPHDNQIQFIQRSIPSPGSGLSAAEVDIISAQVRKALRDQFVAADVLMPAGFHFAEFIALGGERDPSQALALPLQLSGSAAGWQYQQLKQAFVRRIRVRHCREQGIRRRLIRAYARQAAPDTAVFRGLDTWASSGPHLSPFRSSAWTLVQERLGSIWHPRQSHNSQHRIPISIPSASLSGSRLC